MIQSAGKINRAARQKRLERAIPQAVARSRPPMNTVFTFATKSGLDRKPPRELKARGGGRFYRAAGSADRRRASRRIVCLSGPAWPVPCGNS